MVIPPYAGNFSAWGLLGADLTQTAARTRITRLADEAVFDIDAVLAELFATLAERARRTGDGAGREIGFDMRYIGQEHTLTIRVPTQAERIGVSVPQIRELFTREYNRTFGHTMEEEIEVVSVRATLRTPLPRRARERAVTADRDGAGTRSSEAWSFSRGEPLDFAIVKRAALSAGESFPGPAIVLEPTATTYVDADFTARVDGSGSLFVRRDS
jgi:N-methylhydantoinase A